MNCGFCRSSSVGAGLCARPQPSYGTCRSSSVGADIIRPPATRLTSPARPAAAATSRRKQAPLYGFCCRVLCGCRGRCPHRPAVIAAPLRPTDQPRRAGVYPRRDSLLFYNGGFTVIYLCKPARLGGGEKCGAWRKRGGRRGRAACADPLPPLLTRPRPPRRSASSSPCTL